MIRTVGIVKRYGKVTALDGLDLDVAKGTVLGLLGPNGAGKTTAVRILTTLLEPDEGTAEVAGLDVRREATEVRRRIGLSGQNAAVDEYLTGLENLEMVGRLYHLGGRRSKMRARELLEQFDLVEAASRPAKTYSGGMRRRLDLAAALVAEPEILFLDEPTTGLDPRSRSQMWDTIHSLARRGSTVLLTTQYMEEADRLADDIVVIDRGRKIAQGTAGQLKMQCGGERIEIDLEDDKDVPAALSILTRVAGDDVQVDEQTRRLTAAVRRGAEDLGAVLQRLREEAIPILDIGLRRPTLDDVFLTLTGHSAEEVAKPEEGERPTEGEDPGEDRIGTPAQKEVVR